MLNTWIKSQIFLGLSSEILAQLSEMGCNGLLLSSEVILIQVIYADHILRNNGMLI